MRGSFRPEPVIPDHEVLRKIGGGSYGEVWLARGVTGAMRAVKVVRREDFEDKRGFEREFEGILKYEPISRDHPGLVDILHVGRSEVEGEFYYYVMELGDDILTGSEINAVEYEARNLLTDMKIAAGTPIDPDVVLDVGVRLSEALVHLHEKGLAHRDIKPSNIIFVEGKAKLADIGLVAARGRRTFVGTEGFVPPEGPGSSQADVYGLGKVLYEMATGNDRLQFPELPEELPEQASRKRWLVLNQVICDICDPRISKRTITTAAELADDLRKLQRGKRVVRRRKMSLLTLIPLIAGVGLAGWILRDQLQLGQDDLSGELSNTPEQPEKIEYGFVKVLSDPGGAEVYDKNGDFIDITPLKNIRMLAGERYEFEFRMKGYRTAREEGVVLANETMMVDKELSIYAPPVAGQEWQDHRGIYYKPMDGYHMSVGYVRRLSWKRYEKALGKSLDSEVVDHIENGVKQRVVMVSKKKAEDYCRWQTARALDGGYLNDSQFLSPKMGDGFQPPSMSEQAKKEKWRAFQLLVKTIPFAHMSVHSVPEGASVLINGVYKGITPLSLEKLKPGVIELSLMLEGFRYSNQTITLKKEARENVSVTMLRNSSVVFGSKWVNSLGMRLVPVSQNLMVSAWETRVSDYATYVKEAKVPRLKFPGFPQEADHPAVQVSRDKANAFCVWLTERERKGERIAADDSYRLLTDFEWSHVAGLGENPNHFPSLRELLRVEHFPWGYSWPPEKAGFKVGNLADKTAAQSVNVSRDRALVNYDDGFEQTSPVGSFPSNEFGIYDLSGNAQEWVSDDYRGQGKYGVLRGGGWKSAEKEHLYTTHRNVVRGSKFTNRYGFRVALVKKPQEVITESLESEADDAP